MKKIPSIIAGFLFGSLQVLRAADVGSFVSIPNPHIDYAAHRETVARVEPLREGRRVSEADFMRMAREEGTVVLDARSGPMFQRLHIAGAVNLSFPDFNAEALAKAIPTRGTRVLIYCNNNFIGSDAMLYKIPPASLNISTFVALTSYGYTNVYELGPLLKLKTTVLPLAGSDVATPARKVAQ